MCIASWYNIHIEELSEWIFFEYLILWYNITILVCIRSGKTYLLYFSKKYTTFSFTGKNKHQDQLNVIKIEELKAYRPNCLSNQMYL